jgi:short subunit dehydrogenase-like uncharacterized protein
MAIEMHEQRRPRPRKAGRPGRLGTSGRLLIYGSTGYTGRLIAQRASEAGLVPVLAGRNAEHVRQQAEFLDLPWRAVALDEPAQLAKALSGVDVVVHAAGPFAETARPMINACLGVGAHYLDIGGELPAFQEAWHEDARALESGVMIMPGAGWVVAASDCLAAHVAALVPDAKYLRLGVGRSQVLSRGTVRAALGQVSSQVMIRRNGRLASVPVGRLERSFDYGEGERWSTALSWPDVLTAHHTTGIPNIEVYVDIGAPTRILAQICAPIAEPLRLPVVQSLLRIWAGALPEGPSDAERRLTRHTIVAEVEDGWRRRSSARLKTADGYGFTAAAVTAIALRILRGDFEAGFQTPARVYGADFVLGFEGTTREDVDVRAVGKRACGPDEDDRDAAGGRSGAQSPTSHRRFKARGRSRENRRK